MQNCSASRRSCKVWGKTALSLEQFAGDAVFGAAGKVSAQIEGLPFAGQCGKILARYGLGQ